MAKRIPALVVSGFLGAGKTTLVRHLLANAQRRGERVAVVVNEFGDLGIDRALLGEGGDAYVELEGGCVCCQLSDDLIETLQMLWEQVRPDSVIVETAGVAMPLDTQLNFWRPPVSEWVGDDMSVVLVNAEQVAEGRDLDLTFEDQVSSADLLVLNKVDLIPVAEIPRVEAALRAIEPETPIVHATQGDVDPGVLFPPDLAGERERRRGRDVEPPPHDHASFETEELSIEAGVTSQSLTRRLRDMGVLRAKGFVETAEGLRLVQVVGRRVEVTPVERAPAELVGRVVVIRRGADAPARH